MLAYSLVPIAMSLMPGPGPIDLSRAVIVVRGDGAPEVERTAAQVLSEEVELRSGLRWPGVTAWPAQGWTIALVAGPDRALHGRIRPIDAPDVADAYAIHAEPQTATLWVVGHDPRGALFGVGHLLRRLECRKGKVLLPEPLSLRTAPAYPIRGHQLGYRATANSYDAWKPEQYDRYIRELTFFGTNAIENIPLQDERPIISRVPRETMNVEISRICGRYGLDHWLWTPIEFDLTDVARRAEWLAYHRKLFRDLPHLAGVFVPGGDPGSNDPELVLPCLVDLWDALKQSHPEARIWMSMQGFNRFQEDYVYRWIEENRPAWLAGLVGGPSSAPLHVVRARLPKGYKLRDYPDITHCVRAQFPVPYWDPAFAFTLGREPVNPRPSFYADIHHDTAMFTDGFITYSDGVHDDLNKCVWSALGWDPKGDLRTVVTEYARVFLGADVAEDAAAGLFALERNWIGSLIDNGTVDGTYALWQRLQREHSDLRDSWRAQMYALRAAYDLYTRKRLIHERDLELRANAALLDAPTAGSEQAVARAREILDAPPIEPNLAREVTALCDALYRSIGLQTSVAKYGAIGAERGATLDFLDYPLNNRWWLEDEMARALTLSTEGERVGRLGQIARWEDPGPGGFYDDIGNVGRSPHEIRNERLERPILDMDHMALPGAMWWVGKHEHARARQSWITSMDWPKGLRYAGLDPNADYTVRTTGYGDCFVRANGVRLTPTLYGKELGAVKEFPVPRGLYTDGMLTITFDPTFEPDLNWRVQSRLCEVWLIRTSNR